MKIICAIALGLCLSGLLLPSVAHADKANGKKAKIIAKYDKNGNGVIDGDEMEAMRKDYAANPNGELKEFDTNHDGKLSDEEIAAIKPGAGSKKRQSVEVVLAKYDKNGNGRIDGDEAEALRKDFAANPNGELKVFDANGDGKLSDDEIAAIRPKATKKEKMAAILTKYDKNGNGQIDGDEAEALRKDFAANPNGDLKQLDIDKDGKLSDAEIAAIKQPEAKKKGGGKSKASKTDANQSAAKTDQ